MNIYYLYIKTHSKTGLKYLGYTTQDPSKYNGSGSYWKRHLKKHGDCHITEILLETSNHEDIRTMGIHYSSLWNIVESPDWANIIPESGVGVIQTPETIEKSINTRKRNGTISNGVAAMKNPEIQKKAGLNSRKSYEFISPTGEIIVESGLAEFCKKHKLDPGNMSSIAHGKKNLKTHKGWKCRLI